MPLISRESSSPTIAGLWINNPLIVLSEARAKIADLRPLRIWLLNNMPDAALKATEQQFLRLIGSEPVLQIEPVLMTCTWVKRSEETAEYIKKYYTLIQDVQRKWLDALIISWANFWNGSINGLPFWNELTDIFQWAESSVSSILTSCLATHAVMKYKHDIDRVLNTWVEWVSKKIWWVFDHKVTNDAHPLVTGMNSNLLVPHSRWNSISEDVFKQSWNQVLIAGTAWVHLATSHDFRYVMMQWHPEYDSVSLAREYLRDKKLWLSHAPSNYLTQEIRLLNVDRSYSNDELQKIGNPENNWRDSAQVMMARWIGLVYRITNIDITKQYMDGIDPSDPLWSLIIQSTPTQHSA